MFAIGVPTSEVINPGKWKMNRFFKFSPFNILRNAHL